MMIVVRLSGGIMILKQAHIRNFRSIRDAKVCFHRQTAILGSNGAGKSTILRALDRFYGQSTSVELDDFFGRVPTQPIEIELTFCDLNSQEQELFSSRIHNGEMTVVRVFEANGGRTNGRYYGMTPQCPAFSGIRGQAAAVARRDAYRALREMDPTFDDLPEVRTADAVMEALVAWEEANPRACELARDDGQFFGFTNVGKGALQKATSFVFIPAVRDASADSLDSRGAVVAKLMELVVRSAIQKRADIKRWQVDAAQQYRELTDPSKLQELGHLSDDLTRTLQVFYAEAGVALRWKATEDFVVPLPIADVYLQEDGFEGPVDRKGHGLQRAFILTLLQHLAKASSENYPVPDQETLINTDNATSAQEGAAQATYMPGLILAIEEPELYQHPTKQRHFSKVLSQISSGVIEGVAAQTQVLFASHSSLFVSMDRFEEIRLARRRRVGENDHKECLLESSDVNAVTRRLEVAHYRQSGEFSADGLKARLHIINTEIAEGFFADTVVLVEGQSDKAAIFAAAQLNGVDLESLGIAVVIGGGKTNLDRLAIIFQELSIPTYVVWDCDRKDSGIEDAGANRALQIIFGRSQDEVVDAQTVVERNFACFDVNIEHIMRDEIGDQLYEELLNEAGRFYGVLKKKDALKVPAVMRRFVLNANARGERCGTLDRVIQAIVTLRMAI